MQVAIYIFGIANLLSQFILFFLGSSSSEYEDCVVSEVEVLRGRVGDLERFGERDGRDERERERARER